MMRSRSVYALLLFPLLLGAAEGKKGCGCGGKTPVDTETAIVVEVLKPEDALKVVSVEPSLARPGVEQAATLFGSGFMTGVAVKIGATPVVATYKDGNTAQLSVPGMVAGTYDVDVTNPDGKSATLRRGYVVKAGAQDCRFLRVQFEFDKADPTAAGQAALTSLKACYLTAGEIRIDGHADERGTTEYNLALGERRAETIQRWLVGAGVLQSRIRTVSYGEEKPLSQGHDEKAWAENRRAEIHATE